MKTLSVRDFFRNPRQVQEWVEAGEALQVTRRNRVVFEVRRPAKASSVARKRRSVGVWSHAGLNGDAAAPLPKEESWR